MPPAVADERRDGALERRVAAAAAAVADEGRHRRADRPLEPSVCELILSWVVASATRLPPLPQFGGRSASDPQAEAHAGADEGERNLLQSMMERPAGFAFSLQNALRREQHDAKGKISQSKPKSMSARRLGECWPR